MLGKPFKIKEFLAEAAELVRMQLPPDLRNVKVVGPVGSLIKLHYGNPRVHYEVWVRRREGTIEIGLHFEGAPETNSHYLAELKERHADVISSLGPEVQPEQWVRSWTRVYRSLPISTLDEDLLMVVSGCLSQMVRLLEPAVREISASKVPRIP